MADNAGNFESVALWDDGFPNTFLHRDAGQHWEAYAGQLRLAVHLDCFMRKAPKRKA